MIETAIVPVAGLGTRLLPVSRGVPKELLPLGQRPALHWIAAELGRAGIRRVILVSSAAKPSIREYFRPDPALAEQLRSNGKPEWLARLWSEGEHAAMEFEVVLQSQQRGLGDAILTAAERVPNESFVVALGDCVIGLEGSSRIVERLIGVQAERDAAAVIAFESVPRHKVHRYGIAAPAEPPANGIFPLADLVEKPNIDAAPSQYAIAARYVLTPRIFDALRETRPGKAGELQLTDAIRTLIQPPHEGFGVLLEEPRFDVGNFQSYTEAFVRSAMHDPELRDSVLAACEGDDA